MWRKQRGVAARMHILAGSVNTLHWARVHTCCVNTPIVNEVQDAKIDKNSWKMSTFARVFTTDLTTLQTISGNYCKWQRALWRVHQRLLTGWVHGFVCPECKHDFIHFRQVISCFFQQHVTHAFDFIAPKSAYLHQVVWVSQAVSCMLPDLYGQSCMMLKTS